SRRRTPGGSCRSRSAGSRGRPSRCRAISPASSGAADAMQGRVLIVDDERALCLALKGLLGKEGYQAEPTTSAEDALRQIGIGSFHVVITDLSMNGVGGMQVLEHARQVDPDLAVIMITAYGSEKIAVQAMKLGAVDYVPKPFDNDELRIVVRRVMETV